MSSLTQMLTSGAIPPLKDDPVFVKAADGTFAALAGKLEKMGARHGKKDQSNVQQIHDAAAALADGVHCCEMAEKAISPELLKANARHSSKDLKRVKDIHDESVALGASCDGTSKMDAADLAGGDDADAEGGKGKGGDKD